MTRTEFTRLVKVLRALGAVKVTADGFECVFNPAQPVAVPAAPRRLKAIGDREAKPKEVSPEQEKILQLRSELGGDEA